MVAAAADEVDDDAVAAHNSQICERVLLSLCVTAAGCLAPPSVLMSCRLLCADAQVERMANKTQELMRWWVASTNSRR